MKRILTVTMLALVCLAARAQQIFSISAGPGEDASTSIGISWACEPGMAQTYVEYTRTSDKNWKRCKTAMAKQQVLWTAFDGVFSDNEKGEPFYENARFTKCGVMLEKLVPDCEYKYRIRTITPGGECSGEHFFKTAGADNWSCCVISDFHSYPPLPGRLSSAMAMIDTMKVVDPSLDWIFCPGDVVAWGGSYSFWKRYFEEDNVAGYMWARANGNHDNWTKESQITHDFHIPNDYFLGTSYYPQNSYPSQMGVNYHFRYGNTLFIMLNTEDMYDQEEFEKAQAWTRNVIRAARVKSDAPVFIVVCLHYEWFIGTNGKTSEFGRWHNLFDELGVDLAVAGNNHVYVRTEPIYDGKVSGTSKGTVYLQTPSSDNGRGRKLHETDFFNSDLIKVRWTEGAHTVGAVHMSVTPKTMTLKLLDRSGAVVDETVISKKK